jgi:hypothetical protein
MKNIRREAIRCYRDRKLKLMNYKQTTRKGKSDLYTDINDFREGYKPRTSVVNEEKGGLFADPQSISNVWRNLFPHLLNVFGVNDVKH